MDFLTDDEVFTAWSDEGDEHIDDDFEGELEIDLLLLSFLSGDDRMLRHRERERERERGTLELEKEDKSLSSDLLGCALKCPMYNRSRQLII